MTAGSRSPLDRPPYARHRTAICGAIATILLLISPFLIGGISDWWKDWRNRVPFDAAEWRESLVRDQGRGYSSENPVRQRMVDDLLDRQTFGGMTRSQVVDFLGPPTGRYDRDGDDAGYLLGPERGSFALDNEWLVVTFGEDGRVKQVKLAVD